MGSRSGTVTPTTLSDLCAALQGAGRVAIVGGGVGLMLAATPQVWGDTNVDLAGLGLDGSVPRVPAQRPG